MEYAYAKKNKLDHIQLKTATGQFVQPEEASLLRPRRATGRAHLAWV